MDYNMRNPGRLNRAGRQSPESITYLMTLFIFALVVSAVMTAGCGEGSSTTIVAGPAGPAGAPGATGATGGSGETGATGDTGSKGTAGASGPTGAAGAEGAQGAPGAPGAPGGKTVVVVPVPVVKQ